MEAQKIIDRYNLYPMTVVQPQYHMMDRYIEHEIIDVFKKLGIGITPFSPLAQGLLTGKYKKGQPYPEDLMDIDVKIMMVLKFMKFTIFWLRTIF